MNTDTPHPLDCLRPNAAVARLGISRATIDRLRKRGEFVPAIRLTNVSIGYRVVDLERWQKDHEGV